MLGRRFAQRHPRRLPASDDGLTHMAWAPSYRAPYAAELLVPPPFVPPGPPKMCGDERKLLDGVLAAPDDDGPRHRFAAWCAGRGDPRGAFIQAQLAGDRSREAELWAVHSPGWLSVFEPWAAKDVLFRRGFAEALSLSGRAFVSLADGLFRTAPVRHVRLVAVDPVASELPSCRHLGRLTRLDLGGCRLGPAVVSALAASPHVGDLRELDLTANDVDDAAADALLQSPSLQRLEVLVVARNPGLSADAAVRLGRRFGTIPASLVLPGEPA